MPNDIPNNVSVYGPFQVVDDGDKLIISILPENVTPGTTETWSDEDSDRWSSATCIDHGPPEDKTFKGKLKKRGNKVLKALTNGLKKAGNGIYQVFKNPKVKVILSGVYYVVWIVLGVVSLIALFVAAA